MEESTVDGQELLAALALATAMTGTAASGSLRSGTPERPDKYSVRTNPESMPMLDGALKRQLQKIAPDSNTDDLLGFTHVKPGEPHHPGALMTRTMKDGTQDYRVKFDNNQDRAILAHELGHYLNNKGALMHKVTEARRHLENSPALTKALRDGMEIGPVKLPGMNVSGKKLFQTSKYLAPALVAGVIPGDDDVAAAVAVNLALSSPTLIDEFMATKRGMDLMKEAGMEIPLKSRARLAGAFSSYLASPLLTAFAGNVAGNFVDQNV